MKTDGGPDWPSPTDGEPASNDGRLAISPFDRQAILLLTLLAPRQRCRGVQGKFVGLLRVKEFSRVQRSRLTSAGDLGVGVEQLRLHLAHLHSQKVEAGKRFLAKSLALITTILIVPQAV